MLNTALKDLRVLSSLKWPMEIRDAFLKNGALPKPEYVSLDIGDAETLVRDARAKIQGDTIVFEWLRRLADTTETTVRMIKSRGTPEFTTHSREIYGDPSKLLIDRSTRVIDLAHHMDARLADLDIENLVLDGVETYMTAVEFSEQLRPLLTKYFGLKAPKVELSEVISAKAMAGSKRIRIRSDATLSLIHI